MYAGLTFLVSPEDAILIQLFVPLLMLTAYLFILGKPGNILPTEKDDSTLTTSHVKNPPPYSKTDHTVADSKTLPGEKQPGDDIEMDSSKPLLDEIEAEDSKPLLGEMEDDAERDNGTNSKWSKLKWSRFKLPLFNGKEAGNWFVTSTHCLILRNHIICCFKNNCTQTFCSSTNLASCMLVVLEIWLEHLHSESLVFE